MGSRFDRGVVPGIVLLALMIVGTAVTSFVNTREVRNDASRAARSRKLIEAIATVRVDVRGVQADQRSYLITGFPDRVAPFEAAAQQLRVDTSDLETATAGDPEQNQRAEAAGRAADEALMNMTAVVKTRGGPGGHAAVVALSRERGGQSYADPLLMVLGEMDRAEHERLERREAEARGAYTRAVLFGATGAVLSTVALALFAYLVTRSARTRADGAAAVARQREWLRTTLASIGDAVIAIDAGGNVTFLNPVAEHLTGWPTAAATGRPLTEVFHIVNETTRTPVENPALRALNEGVIVGLANHTILIARDGSERHIDDSAAPIRSEGAISGSVLVFRDITERRGIERQLDERMGLLRLGAEVGAALTAGGPLPDVLRRCAEGLVQHSGAALARVWALEPGSDVLVLRASAGLYTHTAGVHARIPVGAFEIGRIARDRAPHMTNAVIGDPHVSDQEWARREGLVAFAGYPLLVGEQLVGVMGLFARHPLSDVTLEALAGVAREIAIGVGHAWSEAEARSAREYAEAIVETVREPLVVLDSESRVVSANRAFHATFRVERAATVGVKFHNLGHGEWDIPKLWGLLREVRESGTAFDDYQVDHEFPQIGRRVMRLNARRVTRPGAAAALTLIAIEDVTAGVRAEQSLAEARRRSTAALQAGEVGTYYWDITTDRVSGDRNFIAMFGVLPDERASAPIGDFLQAVHPDDTADLARQIRITLETDAPFKCEYRVNSPTGERWVLARGAVERDDNGAAAGWAGVLVDITDRKRAERQLAASEGKYRTLFEGMTEGYCVAEVAFDEAGRGTDYRVLEMNPAFERHSVLRGTIGRAVSEVAPDPEPFWAETYGRVAVTGEPARVSGEVRALGGRHFDVSAFRLGGPGSRTVAVLFADASERVAAERERQRLHAAAETDRRLLDAIFEALPVGLVVADPTGRLLRMNRANRDLWGGPPQTNSIAEYASWVGYWEDTGARVAPHEWALARVLTAGETVTGDAVEIERFHGGGRRHVVISGAPVRAADGTLIAGVLAQVDVTDRKRAEDQQREAERQFRTLFESMNEGYCVIELVPDPAGGYADFRYLLANPAFERHTGMRDFVGRTVRDVLPGYEQHIIDTYGQVVATGEPVRFTTPVTGLGRWYDVSAFRIGPPADRRVGVLFADVTARRTAETRIRETDQRLQLLLGTATDYAVILTGPDGRVTDWLGGAGAITGYAREDMVGKKIETIFTPEDRAAGQPAREMAAAAASGRGEDKRWHRRKDGSEFYADGVMVPLRGDDGSLHGFGKVFRDATARKRAEDGVRFLADASATLAELVDYESTLGRIANIAVGAFADWCVVDVLEPDGRRRRLAVTRSESAEVASTRAADAAFREDGGAAGVVPHVLRTGEPEVVPDIAALDPASAPQGADRISRLRAWGLRSYLSVPLLSHGGTIGGVTFLSCSGRRLFGPDELRVATDLAGRVAVALENAQLYRALQETDRRKDEFLATLAHELRNPLAPVRNGVQILRMVPPGASTGRTLDMMERQLGQMAHLVDDLMDVSRVSSGKVVLRKERVEAREVLEAAVETSRQLIEKAGHELTVGLPPEPVWLEADRTRLVQVFANLLNNAGKYTPAGGRIALSAVRDQSELVVRVADNGVGIPAEMLPKVFDLFTQVGASLERSQGGLGIGLTLVRRLIEMHGGTVTATSSGPGQGSTFTVRVPVAQDPGVKATEPRPHAAVDPARAKLSVLVVDDNRDAAESLALLLTIRGHDVRTAHDGPEALREVAQFRPQLILLDLGLPGMSGYEVARQIRASDALKGITIVALTGWGQDEDRRRTRAAGFDHHLVKPVDPSILDTLLANPTAPPDGPPSDRNAP